MSLWQNRSTRFVELLLGCPNCERTSRNTSKMRQRSCSHWDIWLHLKRNPRESTTLKKLRNIWLLPRKIVDTLLSCKNAATPRISSTATPRMSLGQFSKRTQRVRNLVANYETLGSMREGHWSRVLSENLLRISKNIHIQRHYLTAFGVLRWPPERAILQAANSAWTGSGRTLFLCKIWCLYRTRQRFV